MLPQEILESTLVSAPLLMTRRYRRLEKAGRGAQGSRPVPAPSWQWGPELSPFSLGLGSGLRAASGRTAAPQPVLGLPAKVPAPRQGHVDTRCVEMSSALPPAPLPPMKMPPANSPSEPFAVTAQHLCSPRASRGMDSALSGLVPGA